MNFRDSEELVIYPSGVFVFGLGVGQGTSGLVMTRMMQDTVNVSINNSATSMGAELTPAQARKLAAALVEVADLLDAEEKS